MKRFGIDLGTTYSAISWYDEVNKRLEIIELNCENGGRNMPSVVYFPGPGLEPVVGTAAVNVRRRFPDRVAAGFKRAMGDTQWSGLAVDGRTYTAEELSSFVLKTLLQEAAAANQCPIQDIEHVVITVPAYFEEPQKRATLEAARLAGLAPDHVSLLEEPQAAALAYAVENALDITDRYILVYDLGGGTFDVVLVHATGEPTADGKRRMNFQTLLLDGNRNLGGLNWNEQFEEFVDVKVRAEHGVSPRATPEDQTVLAENCEKGKRDLSKEQGPVLLLADQAGHQVEVSQTEFESATAGLLEETRDRLRNIIDRAGQEQNIPADKIEVLLSGGSTRMPMCRRMIQEVTGRDPLRWKSPDYLVSMGAAYQAYLMTGVSVPIPQAPLPPTIPGEPSTPLPPTDVIMSPIVSISHYAIGVEVIDPSTKQLHNSVMLPVGSKFGPEGDVEHQYFKAEDNTTHIRITLKESPRDTEDLSECKTIYEAVIGPLPPGGKRGESVRVRLGHTVNGVIEGVAVDEVTGQSKPIRVERR